MSTVEIPSKREYVIEGENLWMLPGLTDPHIACGMPEDDQWLATLESAIKGGVTSVVDVPTIDHPCETSQELQNKKISVEKRLNELNMPLSYSLYAKGNSKKLDEVGIEKKLIVGSLILLDRESMDLNERNWDRLFQLAAWEDLPVVINSRSENGWRKTGNRPGKTLLETALYYAEKQSARLYVLNVASQEEIDLIEGARRKSLLVYAETTPQYLFPFEDGVVDFLWDAIDKGIIETIGSGYNVDFSNEIRLRSEGFEFDSANPQFLLPMLLTAYHSGKITLDKIVSATRVNLPDVLGIERKDQDVVLVNLDKEKEIVYMRGAQARHKKLKGWPAYTVLKGEVFQIEDQLIHLT